MRVRLRPAYPPPQLAQVYGYRYDHTRWPDHIHRVAETISFARDLGVPRTVADLSCGDAAIGKALVPSAGQGRLILGDLAPGWELCGPIEETLPLIREQVGMFLLCETAEHLDDPDTVLAQIRAAADTLVLSTPLGETTAANPEHYWGWDHDGVRDMLTGAGWAVAAQRDAVYTFPTQPPQVYTYQLWGCR